DVGILVAGELARRVLGHGGADAVEEVAQGEADPVGGEFRAGQRRSLAIALGGLAMTGRAIGGEPGLATGGLGRGIDTAHGGGGRGLGEGRLFHGQAASNSRETKSSRQQGDPVPHVFWSVPFVIRAQGDAPLIFGQYLVLPGLCTGRPGSSTAFRAGPVPRS